MELLNFELVKHYNLWDCPNYKTFKWNVSMYWISVDCAKTEW